MARSSESLWLSVGGAFVTISVGLLAAAVAIDLTRPHYAIWSSDPMLGSYASAVAAVACFAGAIREVRFPLATGRAPEPAGGTVASAPLDGLVEVLPGGSLPRIGELDPYTLGATTSRFGDAGTYGLRDEYVPRTKDGPLAAALNPGRLVILVGPSKAGKTRTAFEALPAHDDWRSALLVAPVPQSLADLALHQALRTSAPVVIWLDDLSRFLPPAADLSPSTISSLIRRPGPTLLLATLRAEQRELLRTEGELTRDVRLVLDNATSIELRSTREDSDEQARAAAAYPEVAFQSDGLAEALAGAPELLRRYHDSAAADPPLHSLVQTAVDWARCSLALPVPEPDLLALAGKTLLDDRPDLVMHDGEMEEALRRARRPSAGNGQAALLRTRSLPGQSRGYVPFDYLVATDDGQDGERVRLIADRAWRSFLAGATTENAFRIGVTAMQRGNTPVAIAASRAAATAGHARAQSNLGVLLSLMDPPELEEARTWYTKAAEAGLAAAQNNLGVLLAHLLAPPDLAEARTWLTKAAGSGYTDAQYSLGQLLISLDPPQLDEARMWLTKAAATGNTRAQYDLGRLLSKANPPELTEARTWFTKAAQAGHADAQYVLGLMLANELDPPELDEARTWYTWAAEAGNTDAQFSLGLLLGSRLEAPELVNARAWYTKAAEAGNVKAQYNLGLLLADHLDPPELDEARMWYTRAAEAGNASAQNNLASLLATRLDPPEPAEARTWWTKAAEAGHVGAQCNLGSALSKLDPPDLAGTRKWLSKAAEAGSVPAQNDLAALLEVLDPPELAEARAWYTEAAQAGNIDAQYNLGQLLISLDPPQLAEARAWLTKAAQAGHTKAQYQLGRLLSSLLNPREVAEARDWLTKAADSGHTKAQYNLGLLLAFMMDPPEFTEARTWWTRAASAGDIDAQRLLKQIQDA